MPPRIVAVVLGLWAGSSLASEPSRVTVAYVPGGDDSQSMDVFVPANAHGAPVLLFFHGGVWRLGDKEQYANVGAAFARRGIVTGVVNYRLVPSVTHADQLADTAAAVSWMAGHAARYGGDPARLYLAGHSAGGELISSLLWGPTPPHVAGLVLMSGIFDLNQPIADEPGGGLEDFIVPVFGRDPARRAALSPQGKIAPTRTRVLVVVAGDDSGAMKAQSSRFEAALRAHGVTFESLEAAGEGHFEMVADIGRPKDATTERMTAFVTSPFSSPLQK